MHNNFYTENLLREPKKLNKRTFVVPVEMKIKRKSENFISVSWGDGLMEISFRKVAERVSLLLTLRPFGKQFRPCCKRSMKVNSKLLCSVTYSNKRIFPLQLDSLWAVTRWPMKSSRKQFSICEKFLASLKGQTLQDSLVNINRNFAINHKFDVVKNL